MDTTSDRSLELLSCLDLTRLKAEDDEQDIRDFCRKAIRQIGQIKKATGSTSEFAAVCVLPAFISLIASEMDSDLFATSVTIATVANFPEGTDSISGVTEEVLSAVETGAHEVDVVFPYRQFLKGDFRGAQNLVVACRDACSEQTKLKVILETGVLAETAHVYRAARLAMDAGADFIKTSTGMVPVNATPDAAKTMLEAIRDSGTDCGFKASGGIHSLDQAERYLKIAMEIMGTEWKSPGHFRIGSSRLLDDIASHVMAERTV